MSLLNSNSPSSIWAFILEKVCVSARLSLIYRNQESVFLLVYLAFGLEWGRGAIMYIWVEEACITELPCHPLPHPHHHRIVINCQIKNRLFFLLYPLGLMLHLKKLNRLIFLSWLILLLADSSKS